jgi:hypothetical protein
MRIDEITNPIVEQLLAAFERSEYPGNDAFPDSYDVEAHDEVRRLRCRAWHELEVSAYICQRTSRWRLLFR